MTNSKVYALIVGVVVLAGLAAFRLGPLNERAKMAAAIAMVNSKLPKTIDEITTQTKVELVGHTITSYYSISQPLDNDAATTAALRKSILQQACAKAETRKMLTMGYTLDNVYDVTTPHGPDQMRAPVKPTDCG